jgi:hypothetical protein
VQRFVTNSLKLYRVKQKLWQSEQLKVSRELATFVRPVARRLHRTG